MWNDATTLGQVHDIAAQRYGSRPCLSFEDRHWTFSEVQAEIDQTAKGLILAGVAGGDHVCLWLGNCPEFVFAFYAIAKVGAVPVPINSRFRSTDMAYVLEQSDASTLILAGNDERTDYMALLREVVAPGSAPPPLNLERFSRLQRLIVIGGERALDCLDWDDLRARAGSISDRTLALRGSGVGGTDLAFIMYTSGTTGFPKGVMHNHRILRSVFEVGVRLATTPADTVVNYLPLFHIYAFYMALLLSPLTGVRHLLMSHFNPGEVLRLVERERATMLHGFELHFKELLDHPDFTRRDLSSLRAGMLGAGMRSAVDTARRFQTVMPTISGWGMTEVGVGLTTTFLDSPIETRTSKSGWAQYDCDVRIVDPDTRTVLSPGQMGEIECRGYCVTSGYYNKTVETEALIDKAGWLRSGDTGILDEQGCLRFYGRFQDFIRVGGENVDPAEVELLLLSHPMIEQASAVAVPQARLGEVVAVFVRLSTEESMTAEAVIEYCRHHIASFKVPREVHFLDEFPITETGKIKKSALSDYLIG